MPVEYETKHTLVAALGPGLFDLAEPRDGLVIADYFPPGDADVFGVRYRVSGAGQVAQAVLGRPASAELTIKGAIAGNARHEQTHAIPSVILHTFPVCVKQRFYLRRVWLGDAWLMIPWCVSATLDLVCASVRPVLEIEGAAEDVDPLAAQVAASPLYTAGGPRYRTLATILPAGADSHQAICANLTRNLAILTGGPLDPP